MSDSEANDQVLRGLLACCLAIYLANFFFGAYIFGWMILPQRIKFRMLNTFYCFALATCLTQIALSVYLLINPSKITSCYIFQKSTPSILHSFICSGVVALGLITISSMHQIKTSLQNMLRRSQGDLQAQEKQSRNFTIFCGTTWAVNQTLIVALLVFASDKFRTATAIQACGMFFLTSLYSYQLFSLRKVMREFQVETAFRNEKKSINFQFAAFAIAFSAKLCFNIFLLFSNKDLVRSFAT